MSTAGQNGSETDFFVTFKPGDYVFREGDEGNSMYIIEDGVIEIIKQIDGEERKLADLEQGDFFGEMSLLDDQPREASARASAETQLLRIDKTTFDQMLRQNPEVAIRMLRKLARRLRNVIGTFEMQEAAQSSAPRPAEAPATPEPPAAPPSAAAAAEVAASEPATPEAAAVQQPQPQPVAARVFKLVAQESGDVIVLPDKAEITVGRPDPVTGITPDVDLSKHDTKRSVSRRHAKIYHRADGFFVCEEIGTANGTFVNNERITTGVPVPFGENDVVSFGRVAMTLHQE